MSFVCRLVAAAAGLSMLVPILKLHVHDLAEALHEPSAYLHRELHGHARLLERIGDLVKRHRVIERELN